MSSCENKQINPSFNQNQSNNFMNKSKNNSQTEQNKSSDNATIKKKPIPTKLLVIFGAIIIVLAVVLVIILVLVTRKKDNYYNNNKELNYEEAEELIGSKKTKENHDLFNQTSKNLDELKDLLDNISFSEINITVNDSYKSINLSSFLNESDRSYQAIKDDLDLYSSRFDYLSKELNYFSKDVSKSYKNLSNKINDCKEEIDNITKQFEKTIQQVAVPLSVYMKENEKNNILRMMESDGFLSKFYEGIDKLNEHFNKIGNGLKGTIDNIEEVVDDTTNKIGTLIVDTVNGIKTFGENTVNFIKEKFHVILKTAKDVFVFLKIKEKDLELSLGETKDKLAYYLETINKEENSKEFEDIMTNLNNLIEEYNIKSLKLEMYPVEIESFANLIAELNINLDRQINELNLLVEILNVEISTSLDLLFIVDITGSMKSYMNEVKKNIISVINGIIDKCPGIDINLGFIGYRDFYEKYYDIDFTQEHENLKDMISEVYTSGGGDLPEDVAFALELALNQSWKSNANFRYFYC